MKIFKKGFTLIETLFALFITGVVAVLVLPTFLNNYDEKLLVTKLQKMHTEFEVLFKSAAEKHGNPEVWDTLLQNNQLPIDYFYEDIETIKKCPANKNCPSWKNYNSLNGTNFGRLFVADRAQGCVITMDGSFVCIEGLKNSCNGTFEGIEEVCGTIYVDVNGMSAPNRFGVDTFLFYYTKWRIVPSGALKNNLVMNCNKDYRYKNNGLGCTTWVLEQGNMKYLRENIH